MTDHVYEWKPELYSRGAYCNHDGCAIRLNPEQVESMLNAAQQLKSIPINGPMTDEHRMIIVDVLVDLNAKARGGE